MVVDRAALARFRPHKPLFDELPERDRDRVTVASHVFLYRFGGCARMLAEVIGDARHQDRRAEVAFLVMRVFDRPWHLVDAAADVHLELAVQPAEPGAGELQLQRAGRVDVRRPDRFQLVDDLVQILFGFRAACSVAV